VQSNEGPSFVAHQYAIAGQSGGFVNYPATIAPGSPTPTPYAFLNNPQDTNGEDDPDPSDPDPDAGPGGGSCFATSQAKYVDTINMDLSYPGFVSDYQPTPCASNYLTILDEMQTAFGTPYNQDWQYVASSVKTIWSGPMAIDRFANAYAMGSPSSQPFAVDPDAGQFVYDISHPTADPAPRPFANLTYLTPCYRESDHPNGQSGRGPEWLGGVVNAIGQSQYWSTTAVIVVWDDWGGWYDHYRPAPFPVHPS
jgi:hypothetical protein